MGSWTYIDRRLEDVLIELDGACRRPRYVGRAEAASPATGNHARHVREQQKLIDEALTVSQSARKGRLAAE